MAVDCIQDRSHRAVGWVLLDQGTSDEPPLLGSVENPFADQQRRCQSLPRPDGQLVQIVEGNRGAVFGRACPAVRSVVGGLVVGSLVINGLIVSATIVNGLTVSTPIVA